MGDILEKFKWTFPPVQILVNVIDTSKDRELKEKDRVKLSRFPITISR